MAGAGMSKIEQLIRNAMNRALRAGIGGEQILVWITEELINEVDGGRKKRT